LQVVIPGRARMRPNPESIFLDDRHMDSGFAGVAGAPE
jgi:hypothetical protein